MRTLFFLLVALASVSAAAARGRAFDLRRDTVAFSNDTAWAYGVDEQGQLHISKREKPADYTHRCFVLSRATLQFHRFARFEPQGKKLAREEYRARIKRLCRIPVWAAEPRERIVFPGFADLRGFSIAYEGLLKETLGNWWPTYLRVGNWRMAMPHFRWGQEAAAQWLARSLAEGRPRALYLARFPRMNHVVVAYEVRREAGGDLRFQVYDPNYPGRASWLLYRAEQRSFDFEKRWYFPGGRVNVMRVFLSPFH